jgi:hypothetical protein
LGIEHDFASRVLMDASRDTNAAGLRQRLQPRSDIDAIAEEVRPLYDHIALMNAYSHLYAPARHGLRVPFAEALLDTDRGPQSLNRAREFGEHPIAHQLENPPTVLGQNRVDDLPPYVAQGFERPGFILAYELAEADHVGREDCGEAARGHSGTPAFRMPS